MKKRMIENLKELEAFAKKIAGSIQPGDVFALVGNLGAGKTTFVQYLAKALGVTARVNSPTFLLMRVYNTNTTNVDANTTNRRPRRKLLISNIQYPISRLIHIDAYRLKSGEDLEAIGAMEYIGVPGTVTVIEWANKVKKFLPENTRWITFSHGKKEGERVVSIK